jgi:ribulose-bisphosphate carboxylase large chain
MTDEPLRARYVIAAKSAGAAREVAGAVAREQTLECVPGLASPALERRLLGRVGPARPAAGGFAVAIDYAPELVAGSVGALVNLLFGNVSLLRGVRLVDVRWPGPLLARMPGPAFGLARLREETGVRGRALLCAILKPVGLSSRALARQASALVRAGVDLIKDDHNLAEQDTSPFDERVSLVAAAVAEENARRGRRCRYLPHLTGGGARLNERVERLHELGVTGALVAPLLLGWEATAALAAESGLLLLAHPTTSGVFYGRRHGIARTLLQGELFRLAGADGVVFPNAGGRFPVTLAECRTIAARLRAPLGDVRPSFPAPGGGMDLARVRRWRDVYGPDTVFLLGSGLLQEPHLGRAVEDLLRAVEPA